MSTSADTTEIENFDPPQSTRNLKLNVDAYLYIQELIQNQIEKASAEKAKANVAIKGDTSVRTSMLMLLSENLLRTLFLETAARPVAWPRLRALFGAPPYHFLLPGDAIALNAGAFGKGRQNMSFDGSKIPSHSAFGSQYIDQFGRFYKICQRSVGEYDTLPGEPWFQTLAKSEIELFIKIVKRSRETRIQIAKDVTKRDTLVFPSPGNVLNLRETPHYTKLKGNTNRHEFTCTVRRLLPRQIGALTAALVVRVE